MDSGLDRRTFMGRSAAAATLGAALTSGSMSGEEARAADGRTVRIGVVGTGGRGRSLLATMLNMPDVVVPALCDINGEHLSMAADLVVKAGQPEPATYTGNDYSYEQLMAREDLDAVIIATYWQWHAPMAVSAMKHGKYAGVEVPAAMTVDECWDLVNTSEDTGMPCMMLENWSFRRDNLALLEMVRQGMFGEIMHVHCAHSHNCIDHWFFDRETGMDRWPAVFLRTRNCDQYPTHSLGPVLSWCDINCGDNFATISSTATAQRGINDYFMKRFGPEHPNTTAEFIQGDIVTSTVRTNTGRTIIINYDMQLPRPYDNRWMLQGTRGIYNEQRNGLFLSDHSPNLHAWEPFGPYQEQHDHPWWREMQRSEGGQDHGGTDYLELSLFIDAVRNGTQTPVDVYDSAVMSSVVGLSEQSIQRGGEPIQCPDFTRGQWRTRKPWFGVPV
jgi:hypothetical protein